MNHITADASVAEIVKLCPGARRVFDRHELKGCGGERGPGNRWLSSRSSTRQIWTNCCARSMVRSKAPSPQPYIYEEAL